MAEDPYKYFRLEARDLLDQFAKDVLELEKGAGERALIQRLLRLAHTLKGAARVVKQPEIADRAHAIEDLLVPFRESGEQVPRASIDAILAGLDEIDGRVGALTQAEEPAAPTTAKSTGDDGFRSVRADLAELDSVLNGVSETHTLLNGLRTSAQAIEQTRHLVDLILVQLGPQRAVESDQPSAGGASRLFSMAEELRRRLGSFERGFAASADGMDRELRQLREAAEQLRLISAGTLFTALERTARDIAREQSKRVIFEGRGGDIRLDSHVLGTIQGALIQIIRNAVAHGLEPPGTRRAAGKPEAGRVIVDVLRRGRNVVFDCRDDGAGVNLDAVRRIAAQRGLSGPKTTKLGTDEVVGMLLRGGISTSSSVTEMSGRGIGLDVVRETVEQLGGKVTFHTEPGQGTHFELVVPMSLASIDVLIVEADGIVATIPLDSVRSSLRIAADTISKTPKGTLVSYGKQAIPFVALSRLLNGRPVPLTRNWSAVVVSDGASATALGVDRLLGTARAVLHPLPEFVPANALVAGASFDAEGNPQLVLDPEGIATEVRRTDSVEPEPAAPERSVLVIDDSLTTRMLERSILESAGYEVDIAISAEEGLESARRKRYGLILVDVEMPGMDGFTFVERIRSNPVLHEIPAILVTSRASPEDRARGTEVGAQGYIVKSEFDQAHLLTMMKSLMG